MGQINLSQSALEVAPRLLGYELLVTDENGKTASGIIVETEAYLASDEASHTFGGITKRNAVMFDEAGGIYVYFTYGMHLCMNIVTGKAGEGEAVLLRALQPTAGLADMWQRRFGEPLPIQKPHTKFIQLTNGPAKLTQALGITLQDNGVRLGQGRIHLKPKVLPVEVTQTTRVGIKKALDKPWRWYVSGNLFISKH